MKSLILSNLILFTTLAFFAACDSDKNTASELSTTTTDKNLMQLTAITAFIEEYYHKDYKQYRKEVEHTFYNKLITYKGRLEPTDSTMQWLISIDIPKLNAESGKFYSDLNKDKVKDLIIVVHTEGGGGGGNIASDDFFTFTSKDDKYLFNSVTTSSELSGCPDNYGYFIATEIRNNTLIGTSACYTEDDGRCCPSLQYKTEVVLKGKKLVFKSKTAQ
jgi:hypothetical protein